MKRAAGWLGLGLVVMLLGCGDNERLGRPDGAVDAGGDAALSDGAADGAADAEAADAEAADAAVADAAVADTAVADVAVADVAVVDAEMTDAAGADAQADAAPTCAVLADGTLCPGSDDARLAERCLAGVCVGTYVTSAVGAGGVGSDANPGTRAAPLATVQAGVNRAAALAAVAAVPKPVTVYLGVSNAVSPAVFNENVTVPDNVALRGGFTRDAAAVWTEAADPALVEVRASNGAGLLVQAATITNSSVVLANFSAFGRASAGAGVDSCAITVRGGADPTLTDLVARGFNGGGGVSAGVCSYTGARPLLRRVRATGDSANYSGGVVVTGSSTQSASFEIEGGEFRSVQGGISASGVVCVIPCNGASIRDARLVGGPSVGVSCGADLLGTGIQIVNSTLIGSESATSPFGNTDRMGLRLETGSPTAVSVSGSRVVGSTMGTFFANAFGVRAAGSSLDLADSDVGALSGGQFTSTTGVYCSGGPCSLRRSRIAGNSGTGSAGVDSRAVELLGTGHLVARSVLEPGRAPIGAISGGRTAGLELGVGSRVENSTILGGTSARGIGVRVHGAFTGAPSQLANCHIDGGGEASAGTSRAMVFEDQGAVTSSVLASVVNSTLLGGVAPDRIVVDEGGLFGDPPVFAHNNLLGADARGILYYQRGTPGSAFTTAAEVNAMTRTVAFGNISADPQATVNAAGSYVLGASSPNRGAGIASATGNSVTVMAPTDDFEGDARPNPGGSAPDIGPDERD